ncbi:MAG TPA: GlsB/YeaQ/YmgE family stress response membrane protein [Gemmatimonadales bacterium]|nr:GlsB/YeaQ/YmgE family stress response membrane protein [Gemmatimonadales bacterium]
MSLVWFLIIGLIAGWLAGKLMKGGGFGLLGDLIIGVIGAELGGFVFGLLGLSGSGRIGSLIVATIGAMLLLYIIRLVKKA